MNTPLVWDPPWGFAAAVVAVVVISVVLILRGWGRNRWTAIPIFANVVLLFVAVDGYTKAQDRLIAQFAQFGEWPPPVARFYLYVGALAFLPLLLSLARMGLFLRRSRARA